MDMQDPVLGTPQDDKTINLNDASATAAAAGIENIAEENDTPQTEADVEVEFIMANDEAQAESKDDSREVSDESLLADAEALLAKDAADISNDEIRRLRQLYSMLHKAVAEATEEGEEAPVPEATEVQKKFEETIEASEQKKLRIQQSLKQLEQQISNARMQLSNR